MKTVYFPALVITALLFFPFQRTSQSADGGSQNVVLLDIGKVFKAHAKFNAGMESMQREVEAFRVEIEQEQSQIQTMAEDLQKLTPDDPKAKQLEATLTKMTADLQVKYQLKNKDFIEREAKLYYATYMHISSTVTSFCDDNGISLVLRHSSEKVDPKSRESVMQTINNPVVFEVRRDITEYIIRQVNAPTAQQATVPTNQR